MLPEAGAAIGATQEFRRSEVDISPTENFPLGAARVTIAIRPPGAAELPLEASLSVKEPEPTSI